MRTAHRPVQYGLPTMTPHHAGQLTAPAFACRLIMD